MYNFALDFSCLNVLIRFDNIGMTQNFEHYHVVNYLKRLMACFARWFISIITKKHT